MRPLNKKRIGITTAIGMVFAYLIAFGSAAWNFSYSQDIQPFKQSKETPVAYIEKNNVKTQYTRVEKALSSAVSGDTVYVIPGTNPTITSDCEVKSGVSLILPYSDKTYKIDDYSKYEGSNINAISSSTFSDDSQTSVNKYRKNNLTIKSGKKLTNNGNLYVGGIVGVNTGQRPTGQTTKEYCQITLEDGASIETNGRLEIYGYIKSTSANGTGEINAKSGYVGFPMVIYDFRGGTYTSTLYSKKVFPFAIFDFPNVQSNLVIEHDSSINVWAKLASRKSVSNSTVVVHEVDDFYLYNPKSSVNSLFKMDDDANATITLRYVSKKWGTGDYSKESYSVNDSSIGTTKAIFEGGVKLHYFQADVDLGTEIEIFGQKIGAINVKSSDYDLPLSYKFDVNVKTGTFTIANRVKFMTGSSLTIDNGAKLVSNSNVAFYTSYTDQSGVAKVYPDNLEPAKCIVNGTMILNGGFGGNITTESINAIVSAGNSFSNSTSMSEMNGDDSTTHSETAKGLISYNSGNPIETNFEKNSIFQSKENGSFYWSSSSINVSISRVGSGKINKSIKLTLNLVFSPSLAYFKLDSVLLRGNHTSTWGNSNPWDYLKLESINDSKAIFTCNDQPSLSSTQWNYNIHLEFYDIYGGGPYSSGSIAITIQK